MDEKPSAPIMVTCGAKQQLKVWKIFKSDAITLNGGIGMRLLVSYSPSTNSNTTSRGSQSSKGKQLALNVDQRFICVVSK